MTPTVAEPTLAPRARAVQGLRQIIEQPAFHPGDELPAEQTLAQQLGVSRGTVRAAIERLIEEGLVKREPNHRPIATDRAQSPHGVLSDTVAIVTSVVEEHDPNLPAEHEEATETGIAEGVSDLGLNLLTLHTSQTTQDNLQRLVAEHPRGILLCSRPLFARAEDKMLLKAASAHGVPAITYTGDPALAEFDRVSSDHEGGTRALATALLSAGCRRVLRLWTTPPHTVWTKAHDRGFERAMQASGEESLPPVIVQNLEKRVHGSRAVFEQRVRTIAGHLVEHLTGRHAVDAIMVGTDCEAFLAAAACRLFGKEPNRDVLITGYDNYWQDTCERKWEPSAPWATVSKNNHLIGREMVNLLAKRLENGVEPPPLHVVVPQTVVRPQI